MQTAAPIVSPLADRDLLNYAYRFARDLGRKAQWSDVVGDPTLFRAAHSFTANYQGNFSWVQHVRDEMAHTGMLAPNAVPGVINSIYNESLAILRSRAGTVGTKRELPAAVAPSTGATLNVAQVADGRYRVVLQDATSIAVMLKGEIWKDEPESRGVFVLTGADQWFLCGKVLLSGEVTMWKKAADAAPRIREALNVLSNASDQIAFGIAYYIEGGECMFCHRNLDTEESLAVGYGPVCAKKQDLPWGKKAIPASVRIARAQLAANGQQPVAPKAEQVAAQPKRTPIVDDLTNVHRAIERENSVKRTKEIARVAQFGVQEDEIAAFDNNGHVARVNRSSAGYSAWIRHELGLDD